MANTIVISLRMLSLFFLALIPSVFASAAAIVNTTNGPVRGEVITLNTNKTFVQYLGIPFAKAKRFEAPESPDSWSKPLNVTKFGPSCPQTPNAFANSTKSMSEDCLSVNVFLPGSKAEQNALLPVMVWIYGGGFTSGSSAFYVYNGGYLTTEGGVVIVTFNYRLGVLGFLSTGTKDLPGNFGLLDQVKALQWVQENIEGFGGDPKRVTIFGESAGGASVALHMLSPLSFGLYHQVILQSGTAVATFAGIENKTAIEVARTFGNILGCSTIEVLKNCLMSKNVSEILEAQKNFSLTATAGHGFQPVADYHFLNDLPFKLLVQGKFNQTVPAMIGVTKNEGGFFVLSIKDIDKGLNKTVFDNLVKHQIQWVYNQTQKVVESVIFQYTDWTNQTNPLVVRQKYIDVISDALFKAPAMRSAQAFVKNKMKTYFYCLDHINSILFGFPPWAGVLHGADLPYVFGTPLLGYNMSVSPGNQSVDIKLSMEIMTLWSDFAKNGKPTSDPKKWPEYTVKDEQYISLSPSSSVQKNMLPEKMAFWNSFVPTLAEPVPTMTPINPPPITSATLAPSAQAVVDKGTENALIAVVAVLGVLLIVLVVVIFVMRRKLRDALSEPGPTTKLI